MAEITRPGPLAGVRPIDFATVMMGPYAALIFGDLGADVIPLGELSEHPQVREQLIEASKKPTALTHTPNPARNATQETRRANRTSRCQPPQQQREQRNHL